MRIATSTIFSSSVYNIDNLQANLNQLQNQLSTGKQILSPSDNPVASAQALDLSQGQSIITQYGVNNSNAQSSLESEETSLKQMVNLLTSVQSTAIQAGNASLSPTEQQALSSQLNSDYQEMMGLANSTDQYGQYLFSGFKGATQPFTQIALGQVSYNGDSGQRTIQVTDSRDIPISDSGADLLVNVKDGNGNFSTSAASANTGTGVVSAGDVTDPGAWNGSSNVGDYKIVFHTVANPASPTTDTTNYDIVNNDPSSPDYNRSMIDGYNYTTQQPQGGRTDTGVTPNAYPRTFTPGGTIVLGQLPGENKALIPNWNFGATVSVSGEPADGDTFDVQNSKNVDVFSVLGSLVTATQNYTGTAANSTQLQNQLSYANSYLQSALTSVLNVQTKVGARLNELQSISDTQSNVSIQYSQSISGLTDLDYAKAISNFSQVQTNLNAAMKSFAQVQNLSLFQYIQ